MQLEGLLRRAPAEAESAAMIARWEARGRATQQRPCPLRLRESRQDLVDYGHVWAWSLGHISRPRGRFVKPTYRVLGAETLWMNLIKAPPRTKISLRRDTVHGADGAKKDRTYHVLNRCGFRSDCHTGEGGELHIDLH